MMQFTWLGASVVEVCGSRFVVSEWEGCLYSTTYNVKTSNRGAVISHPDFAVWNVEAGPKSLNLAWEHPVLHQVELSMLEHIA